MKCSYITSLIQGNTITVDNSDITIIIDVLRAFTVSKVLFEKGAKRILLALDQKQALQIKQQMKERSVLLAGEHRGLKIPEFDLDNSPYNINDSDLGYFDEIIQMTTNGTKAALNAKGSELVIVTGMTNAQATVKLIKSELLNWTKNRKPNIKFIASHPDSDEDIACAEYMIELLENPRTDAAPYLTRVISSKVAKKFSDSQNLDFIIEDLHFSAQVEKSNYAMEVIYRRDESFIQKRII